MNKIHQIYIIIWIIINIANIKDENEKLWNKIKNLEQKVLNVVNQKLEVNLTGNEIKINLKGKNVGNFEFELLCSIPFKKLEELNLENNKISNIDEIKNLNSPGLTIINLSKNKIENIEPLEKIKSSNIQKIDLSFNEIINFNPIKEIVNNNNNENIKINLNNNKIKNTEIGDEIFKGVIILDDNKEIEKELKEIKDLIKKGFIIKYSINEFDYSIKLFSEEFLKKNKNNFNILINDNEFELTENYLCQKDDKGELEVKLIAINNIDDLSYMFNECSLLTTLEGISKWQTENVTDMSYMFNGCSKLTSLEGISKWQTENVTNMTNIFDKCPLLSFIPSNFPIK